MTTYVSKDQELTALYVLIYCGLLPPATKLGQGYVFTGVCDSVHRGGLPQCMLGYTLPPTKETPLPRRTPSPTKEDPLPHQGDPPPRRPPLQRDLLPSKETPPPGPHPGGKLRGIRSRPTAKGEIEGDQIQAHTKGGNSGGSDPGPHPRGKFRGIRSRPTPKGEFRGSGPDSPPPSRRRLLLLAVRILLECILVRN